MSAAAIVALFVLTSGCKEAKQYRVELADAEAITPGAQVTLNDKPIGEVREIRRNAAGIREAVFAVTVPDVILGTGVERQERNGMCLSGPASGTPLENGAIIPTRQPVVNLAKTAAENARAFIFRFHAMHPDAFTLLAILGAGLVALVAFRFIRKVIFLIPLLAFIASPATAGVKRQDIENDLRVADALVAKAEQYSAEARRLVVSGLTPAAEDSAVRSLFYCDRTVQFDAANCGKIAQLSWTAGAETKASLHAKYEKIDARRSAVEDIIARIAGNTTNGVLRIFLTERPLIKNGEYSDDEGLLARLHALTRFPQPLVLNGLINVLNVDRVEFEGGKIRLPDGQTIILADEKTSGKTPSEFAQLERQQQELQSQLANLAATRATTIIVTNVIEKTSITPAPPPVTNEIVRLVTNRIFVDRPVTNTERIFVTNRDMANSEAASELPSNAVPKSAPGNPAGATPVSRTAPDTQTIAEPHSMGIVSTKTASPKPDEVVIMGKGALPWLGLVAICGVMAGGFYKLTAARTGTVQLAMDGRILDPIEITTGGDVVVLAAPPSVEPLNDSAGKAHLNPAWCGTILRPGEQAVTVNDVAVTKPRRVHRGDSIAVGEGEAIHKFDFLGWDVSSATTEA